MHQFFIEDCQAGREYVTITGSDVRHIRNVLRMKPGEKIRVSTASGRNLLCRIAEIGDSFVQADILDAHAPGTELDSKIYLFQAVPKGSRMENVIEKCVELGVYEIIPTDMKYCVVRLDEKKAVSKIRRWQAISESAAKQSKRSLIPEIHPVVKFAEAVSMAETLDVILTPYENHRGMQATAEALSQIRPGKSIGIFIGPEGGFSEEEIAILCEKSAVLSLGRRILRTDTAAITMLSMLMLDLEAKSEGRRPAETGPSE